MTPASVNEATSRSCTPSASLPGAGFGRLAVLDGWRAVSILLVLAGHWLPLNPIIPGSNEAVAATGMAIFFTLSGFLITRFLFDRPQVGPFLIRRLFRILPLAWLAIFILYWFYPGNGDQVRLLVANLFFYANLPPFPLLNGGGHLWSLCVEMQFYVGAALLVACGGRRALLALPMLAIIVTAMRIAAGARISIVSWYRVDEILAGATLAIVYFGHFGDRPRQWLMRYPLWLAVIVAILCCFFLQTPLAYGRPYAIAALVGATLLRSPAWFQRAMSSRPALYIAEISYAVYVIHGMLGATWLGSGGLVEKYLKRPLLAAATLAVAHVSTFYYERYFIRLAKGLTPDCRAGKGASRPVLQPADGVIVSEP